MRHLPFVLLLCALVSCSRDGASRFHYVPVHPSIPAGKTGGLTTDEMEVERLLQTFVASPAAVSYFKNVLHTAVLVVRDFDDLTFTVHIADAGDKATLTRGTEPNLAPDYVIPLTRRNCENLVKMVDDGRIDDEEAYRIHLVTFVPVLRALFQLPPLYNELVARELALPPLIHMTLKNDKHYLYNGSAREESATVMNVNGQWLVFEGLQGDPDLKTEATLAQVVSLTALLHQPVDVNDRAAALARLADVKQFLKSITVSRREQP